MIRRVGERLTAKGCAKGWAAVPSLGSGLCASFSALSHQEEVVGIQGLDLLPIKVGEKCAFQGPEQ